MCSSAGHLVGERRPRSPRLPQTWPVWWEWLGECTLRSTPSTSCTSCRTLTSTTDASPRLDPQHRPPSHISRRNPAPHQSPAPGCLPSQGCLPSRGWRGCRVACRGSAASPPGSFHFEAGEGVKQGPPRGTRTQTHHDTVTGTCRRTQ